MGEAIEQRAGEALRSKNGSPFIERQIAGDERRAAFVALAEDIEEKLRANCRERHVAEFVDDQQFDSVEVLLQRAKAAFVSGFHKFMHKSGSCCESDAVTLLALNSGDKVYH